jgi:polysaccharide biosynthesis/export protein
MRTETGRPKNSKPELTGKSNSSSQKMTKKFFWSLCLAMAICGCNSTRIKTAPPPAPLEVTKTEARYRKEYVWVPGDQMEVVVRRSPEVSRTVVIRPDGFITLPVVDDIRAAGLTPIELKQSLMKAFSVRMLDPEVTVIATQVSPPVVYVMGDVVNSMPVPLRNASTATAAIAFAGGFKRSAKPQDTAIIRLNNDGHIEVIQIADDAGGQPGPIIGLRNQLLQADDIVFVPESNRSQVTRFLDDFINRPLTTIEGTVGLYYNFRLIQLLTK